MFRVWVDEDRPQSVLMQNWTAKTQQLIIDFSINSGKMRKRDDSPACSLPSNLPEAARIMSGLGLIVNRSPNVDETHSINIGVSADPTTTIASDSGSSTGPTATTSFKNGPSFDDKSLNCMIDKVP